MTRDPRVHPRPGDVVRFGEEQARYVRDVRCGGCVIVFRPERWGADWTVGLDYWRRDCATASIVKTADGEEGEEP